MRRGVASTTLGAAAVATLRSADGTAASSQPGDEFAGHRILGVAGRGGMGVVYRALQPDLDRVVALKLIATPLARDEAFRERFVRESRAAAAIDHPNVIPVYYAGEDDGRLYLAMRFVDGDDLRTLVAARRARSRRDARPRRSSPRSAPRSTPRTRAGSSTATSSPPTSCSHGDHAYLTDFGLTKRLHCETPS